MSRPSDGDDDEGDEGDDDGLEPSEERPLADEAGYVCGACGELIVVPLDPSAGAHQAYVEDCPVCCTPNEVQVDFDEDGAPRVSSRLE